MTALAIIGSLLTWAVVWLLECPPRRRVGSVDVTITGQIPKPKGWMYDNVLGPVPTTITNFRVKGGSVVYAGQAVCFNTASSVVSIDRKPEPTPAPPPAEA